MSVKFRGAGSRPVFKQARDHPLPTRSATTRTTQRSPPQPNGDSHEYRKYRLPRLQCPKLSGNVRQISTWGLVPHQGRRGITRCRLDPRRQGQLRDHRHNRAKPHTASGITARPDRNVSICQELTGKFRGGVVPHQGRRGITSFFRSVIDRSHCSSGSHSCPIVRRMPKPPTP